MKRSAEKLNAKGIALEEKGWSAEAEKLYLKATEADPSWSVPWFNLGLLAKRQRRWADSLKFNQAALARDSSDEGAWWNLGIAATAQSNWAEARRAWQGFGIEIPDGEGPLDLDLGPTPIRICPDESGEVVWCRRIDPARAIVESIPLPESERRYGDLLLHDGAPNGYRLLEGHEVDVFDELELLSASRYSTYEVICRVAGPDDIAELEQLSHELDLSVENWSENVRILCKECSEGIPHQHHLHEATPWTAERRVAIAATSDEAVGELLDQWTNAREGVSVVDVTVLLDAEVLLQP
jgi:tetratricopeptide (TPR) repeat protein